MHHLFLKDIFFQPTIKISVSFILCLLLLQVLLVVFFSLIRMELAEPGMQILGDDYQRYNVWITAHGLLMIFFYDYASNGGWFWKLFCSSIDWST